jgi:hypothetical protein
MYVSVIHLLLLQLALNSLLQEILDAFHAASIQVTDGKPTSALATLLDCHPLLRALATKSEHERMEGSQDPIHESEEIPESINARSQPEGNFLLGLLRKIVKMPGAAEATANMLVEYGINEELAARVNQTFTLTFTDSDDLVQILSQSQISS